MADNVRVQTDPADGRQGRRPSHPAVAGGPGVVFERLVISRGDLPASYLGPAEGVRR